MAMIHLLKRRASLFVASALLMLTFALPAYAQNPFTGAAAEIDTWVGYGLAAGAVGAIILAAVGVGKAVFRRLAG